MVSLTLGYSAVTPNNFSEMTFFLLLTNRNLGLGAPHKKNRTHQYLLLVNLI